MGSEVYPHPPVVLVVCEIRHPRANDLTPREMRDLREALRPTLPLYKPFEAQSIEMVSGNAQPTITREMSPRFVSRDRTRAVTVAAERVVVETTAYSGFEDFRELLCSTIRTVSEIRPPDGVERIGLRYIDELRVPLDESGNVSDWSEWLADSIVGPSLLATDNGITAVEWQALARFDTAGGSSLVLRYGPRVGIAVDPGAPLRRTVPDTVSGPFFLLDFDSYWESGENVPEFEAEYVAARCDELHQPISGLFESLITSRLRDEVLRHDG